MSEDNHSRTEQYLDSARHSLIYNEDFSPADWYFSPANAVFCWGLFSKSQSGGDHMVGFVPASRDHDMKTILPALADEFFHRYHNARTPARLTLVTVIEGEFQERMANLVGYRSEGRHTVFLLAVDAQTDRMASPQEFKPGQPGARSIGFLPEEETVQIPEERPVDEKVEREKARRYFRQRAQRSLSESGRTGTWARPVFTLAIIGINILMLLVEEALGGSTNSRTLILLGAKVTRLIQLGQWWRIFTYQFLHIGLLHLFVNSYSLYNLGPFIEDVYGRWQFLVIYLLSGTMGGLASAALSQNSISAGASGAIFGLLGAMLAFMLSGKTSWDMIYRTVGVPILATLGYGLLLRIDHFAHFGGLIGGFLVAMAFGLGYRTTRQTRIAATAGFVMLFVLLWLLV